jgi:FLVCR family MFS transporter 7
MFNSLIFQAVVAMAVLPLPLMLGIKRLGFAHGKGRLRVDEHRDGAEDVAVEGSAGQED